MSAALQRRAVRAPELARAGRRVGALVALGLLPVLLALVILVGGFRSGTGAWAIDFNGNFLVPAHEILHGVSPYHPGSSRPCATRSPPGTSPTSSRTASSPPIRRPDCCWGCRSRFSRRVWPSGSGSAAMVAAGWLALRIVGVRDWRVYGVALLTPAALSSLLLGAVDFSLVLGLAACWRWRDQASRAGVALGVIVALKLVALPLVAWLLVTRRWRAAVSPGVVSLGLWLAGWAVIGFHGFAGYPHLLSLLTEIESKRGYSPVAYANALGISGGAADLAPYAVGVCLLGAMWFVSRRREGGDEAAFLLGVLALLAFSPIVWHHYLVLLFVPLAIYCPRFAPIWTLPLLSWLAWRGAFFYPSWGDRIVFG